MQDNNWIQHWNDRYTSEEYVYGRQPNEFLRQNVNVFPGSEILCVADGEGRNSVWLARQGYMVTAIDYSAKGIKKARKLAERYQVSVKLIKADLLEYKLGKEKYDGVVSVYSHFKKSDMISLHQRYTRALKPGGIFLMEVFSKDQIHNTSGGPKDIEMLYDMQSIKVSFPDLGVKVLNEETIILDEGPYHQGKANIIRAILHKPGRVTRS